MGAPVSLVLLPIARGDSTHEWCEQLRLVRRDELAEASRGSLGSNPCLDVLNRAR
jgi:hypothetical protein